MHVPAAPYLVQGEEKQEFKIFAPNMLQYKGPWNNVLSEKYWPSRLPYRNSPQRLAESPSGLLQAMVGNLSVAIKFPYFSDKGLRIWYLHCIWKLFCISYHVLSYAQQTKLDITSGVHYLLWSCVYHLSLCMWVNLINSDPNRIVLVLVFLHVITCKPTYRSLDTVWL